MSAIWVFLKTNCWENWTRFAAQSRLITIINQNMANMTLPKSICSDKSLGLLSINGTWAADETITHNCNAPVERSTKPMCLHKSRSTNFLPNAPTASTLHFFNRSKYGVNENGSRLFASHIGQGLPTAITTATLSFTRDQTKLPRQTHPMTMRFS